MYFEPPWKSLYIMRRSTDYWEVVTDDDDEYEINEDPDEETVRLEAAAVDMYDVLKRFPYITNNETIPVEISNWYNDFVLPALIKVSITDEQRNSIEHTLPWHAEKYENMLVVANDNGIDINCNYPNEVSEIITRLEAASPEMYSALTEFPLTIVRYDTTIPPEFYNWYYKSALQAMLKVEFRTWQ